MVKCCRCHRDLSADDFRNDDAAAHETTEGIKCFCSKCWSSSEDVTPGASDGGLDEAILWFKAAGSAGSVALVTAATAAVSAGVGVSLVAGHLVDLGRVGRDRVSSDLPRRTRSASSSVNRDVIARLACGVGTWLEGQGRKLLSRSGGSVKAQSSN